MGRIGSITVTAIGADADGISVAQTTGGAGNLTITGVFASGGVATFGPVTVIEYPGASTETTRGGSLISLTSTGNLSGVTFTVTGVLYNGTSSTEAITGPNNNTVVGTKHWRSVSQ